MSQSRPRVSVGLPVYNGDNYIEQAIESVLAQSYDDLELVVSSNASVDGTDEILARLARQDPRIRYFRQPVNVGAADNYNFVFRRSRGEYFKWLAHDDLLEPTFVERLLSALEAAPDAALAFSRLMYADEQGQPTRAPGGFTGDYALASSPVERYRGYLADFYRNHARSAPFFLFGLIRRSALEKTRLHQKFLNTDHCLVGEVMLQGPFVKVDEVLWYFRRHREQYSYGYLNDPLKVQTFWDPNLSRAALRRAISRWICYVEWLEMPLRHRLSPADKLAATRNTGGLLARMLAEKFIGRRRWAAPLG